MFYQGYILRYVAFFYYILDFPYKSSAFNADFPLNLSVGLFPVRRKRSFTSSKNRCTPDLRKFELRYYVLSTLDRLRQLGHGYTKRETTMSEHSSFQ